MDPIILGVLSSPLFSGIAFLAGLWVGNWLAIGRDRRKERIDAAREVRDILFSHRERITPNDKNPTAFQFDVLERLLYPWQRSGFRKAIVHYAESRKEQSQRDSIGGSFYADDKPIVAALETLLRYTDWT